MLKLASLVLLLAPLVINPRAAAAPEFMDGVAAIANDRVITFSEVRQYVQPAMLQLRREFSGPELVARVSAAQMDALNNLIDRALIVHEYNEKGYRLPDTIIDTQIDEVIAVDFGGNREAFINTLQAESLTLSQYRERLRERIIIQMMRNRKMEQEVVVSPYQIEKYYAANIDNYQVADQIKLRMIFIKKFAPPADLAAEATATWVDPQKKVAGEIAAKLQAGDSFESLAKAYSQAREAERGGDWGWIGRDVLMQQLSDVAFALQPGQHSDLIETPDAYYFLFVEDFKPAHTTPLANVRDEIERQLVQELRTAAQEEWVRELRQRAYIRIF